MLGCFCACWCVVLLSCWSAHTCLCHAHLYAAPCVHATHSQQRNTPNNSTQHQSPNTAPPPLFFPHPSTPTSPIPPPHPPGPTLAHLFADPATVKVLHGADHDILWLQRDFGLYVVNMFDTGQASRVLGLQGHGFGFVLKHYCNVQVWLGGAGKRREEKREGEAVSYTH